MSLPLRLDTLDQLHRTPASEVKKSGWRGVMQTVDREGRVLITNHNRPEAIILSVEEYDALQNALRKAQSHSQSTLDSLRSRFDQRLAVLQSDDAGDRLRRLMGKPARLGGKVKAGTGY